MFGFFKKKKDEVSKSNQNIITDKEKQLILDAREVAFSYSELFQENKVIPGMIYDVRNLPHDKEHIKNCCILWMKICPNKNEKELWKDIFPSLAQFQEGVGEKPIGRDFGNIDIENSKPDEVLKWYSENRGPSELIEKVNTEYDELSNIVVGI